MMQASAKLYYILKNTSSPPIDAIMIDRTGVFNIFVDSSFSSDFLMILLFVFIYLLIYLYLYKLLSDV